MVTMATLRLSCSTTPPFLPRELIPYDSLVHSLFSLSSVPSRLLFRLRIAVLSNVRACVGAINKNPLASRRAINIDAYLVGVQCFPRFAVGAFDSSDRDPEETHRYSPVHGAARGEEFCSRELEERRARDARARAIVLVQLIIT